MSSIELRTGTEGPRHDPYGWDEITVSRENGDEVCLHSGLILWVKLNGRQHYFSEWKEAERLFEVYAGITPAVARNAYERQRTTCEKCGCTEQRAQSGMPGETMYFCIRCDTVVYCDFNEAAII